MVVVVKARPPRGPDTSVWADLYIGALSCRNWFINAELREREREREREGGERERGGGGGERDSEWA